MSYGVLLFSSPETLSPKGLTSYGLLVSDRYPPKGPWGLTSIIGHRRHAYLMHGALMD